MFEEDIEILIQKLVSLTDEKAKYKGKIWTNAKGEASFEARVMGDSVEQVITAENLMAQGLMKICTDNNIPIAGASH